MEQRGLGDELIAQGWDQGSLLSGRSARHFWLARSTNGQASAGTDTPGSVDWNIREELLDDNDYLIVASQLCDIARDTAREPLVEVLRASWTNDKQILNEA